VQRNARKPSPSAASELKADVAVFSQAFQELLRVYQLRDRERICCYDVTVTECYALEALVRSGAQSLGEVAKGLRLDKSTTSRAIRSLEEKGYVLRGLHPADGRLVVLEASTRGRELSDRIQQDLRGRYEGILESLDADERAAVVRVIRGLQIEAVRSCSGNC
jgi:DNA-binding MarR family transcriptional regulator